MYSICGFVFVQISSFNSEFPYQVGISHQTATAFALLIADYPQSLCVLHGLTNVIRLEVHPALVQKLLNVLNGRFSVDSRNWKLIRKEKRSK